MKEFKKYKEIGKIDLENITGGALSIVIGKTVYTGVKAYAILAGGGVGLAGIAGLAGYVGFNDAKK